VIASGGTALTGSYQSIPDMRVTFDLAADSHVMIKYYLNSGVGVYRVSNDGSPDVKWLGNNQWSKTPSDGNFSFAATYLKRYTAGTHTVDLEVKLGYLSAAELWGPLCVEVYKLPDALVDSDN